VSPRFGKRSAEEIERARAARWPGRRLTPREKKERWNAYQRERWKAAAETRNYERRVAYHQQNVALARKGEAHPRRATNEKNESRREREFRVNGRHHANGNPTAESRARWHGLHAYGAREHRNPQFIEEDRHGNRRRSDMEEIDASADGVAAELLAYLALHRL